MENGFSSPRTDAFPAGLRVLVVDDDPTWLKILEKMLKKCSYEVTTCCLARDALDLLRERKDGFDIVISDVNMPDMDGFKLLEHVGLEMDLPVIMMSVDGETKRVMKGVQHGACDYLLKPIRMKELRNIWQHVFRKRIHEVRDIESHEGIDEIQMMRNGLDQSDDMYLLNGVDMPSGKKRKDGENKHEDRDFGDPSSVKKARVVWTVDLHQKFVKAVNHIGFDKVGPKKILDLMNVPWLTRENVASHLQKYRLYLSRLQKDNDLKGSFGGIRHSDVSPKDAAGTLDLHNSATMQQHDAVSGNYGFSGHKIHVQSVDPKIHEGDAKGIVSLPTTEPAKALTSDIADPQKASCSMMGLNQSLGLLEREINYAAFDSTITPYTWNREIPEIQYKQEHKKHLQPGNGFNHLPLPAPQPLIQVDRLQLAPSINPGPFNVERDKLGPIEIKASYAKYRSNQIRHIAPVRSANDLFSIISESNLTDFSSYVPNPTSLRTKNQSLNRILINDSEPAQRNLILGSGPAFADRDAYTMFPGIQNKEVFDYNQSELVAEVPVQLYDSLRFDYEYPSDLMDYPVIDRGLFIA